MTHRLETDTFCAHCGYNLHGQDVWRDDRLDLLVCRCPECGKHHPAGIGTSAGSVWLKRLGTLALLVWVGLAIGFIGLWALAMGGMQVGYVSSFTFTQMVAADGTPVTWDYNQASQGYINSKTHKPEHGPINGVLVADPSLATFGGSMVDLPGWRFVVFFLTGAALLGFVGGGMVVIAMWHWPRWRYAFICLVPIAVAGVVMMSMWRNVQYAVMSTWAIKHVALVAAFQIVGVLIAVVVARPLARLVARTVVPPKPRMLLKFLWAADGKAMPDQRQSTIRSPQDNVVAAS